MQGRTRLCAIAVAASLTVAACGASAPLNPAYRSAEFEFYLADLRADALIVPSDSHSPAAAVARARGIATLELAPRLDGEAGTFTLHAIDRKTRTAPRWPIRKAARRTPARGSPVPWRRPRSLLRSRDRSLTSRTICSGRSLISSVPTV